DGEISAFALYFGGAERNEILLLRNFALVAVENGIFEEEDRIVVPDGGLEQTLDVIRGGGHDDLHAGVIGEDIFRSVGVRGANIGATIGRTANDNGAVDETAGHVTDVGGVVQNLVEGDGVERPEHEFHHGTDAEHRGTDTHPDETG